MATDLSKLNFHFAQNYMKRDISGGTTTVTLPSYGSTVTYTVTHNLGYIPFYQVSIEQDATGKIWFPNRLDKYTDTSLGGNDPADPRLDVWITTTTLVITLTNSTNPTATGTRVLYWLIYKDYGTS